jgi:predicted nucleic acid-binding protein
MKKQDSTIKTVLPVAVIDTNVLHPVITRDILLWFALEELFIPRWSAEILAEWQRVLKRMNVNDHMARQRITVLQRAFPMAMVRGYKKHMQYLHLPDTNDRHVLAAAIQARAHFIVTSNTKDFPQAALKPFGIRAITADVFLSRLIEQYPSNALQAFMCMVDARKRPVQSKEQVIQSLLNNGLRQTAERLKNLK